MFVCCSSNHSWRQALYFAVPRGSGNDGVFLFYTYTESMAFCGWFLLETPPFGSFGLCCSFLPGGYENECTKLSGWQMLSGWKPISFFYFWIPTCTKFWPELFSCLLINGFMKILFYLFSVIYSKRIKNNTLLVILLEMKV